MNRMMNKTQTACAVALFLVGMAARAQQPADAPPEQVATATQEDAAGTAAQTRPADAAAPAKMDRRAYGVLPNYRAADGMAPFHPITTAQKYGIGLRDSFDKPVYLLAGFYAGIAQLEDSNPSFGQGMRGFGRRYISARWVTRRLATC